MKNIINLSLPNSSLCAIFSTICKASKQYNKKTFFFFYPHTLTIRLKRPVYRGFKCEGKCEGKLSPLTLTLTLALTP